MNSEDLWGVLCSLEGTANIDDENDYEALLLEAQRQIDRAYDRVVLGESSTELLLINFNQSDHKSNIREKPTSPNKTNLSSFLLAKLKIVFVTLRGNQSNVSSYIRLASVGVLVLSIWFLTTFVIPSFTETSEFIPAAVKSESNDETTTFLLVGFNGSPEELGNNVVLKGKFKNIEIATEGKGFYKIIFDKILSPEEIVQTLNALEEQHELIWFAGEAF